MMLIVVKTQFEAYHAWPGCPFEEVSFLKNTHRHIFHVVIKWEVWHEDRELEFFILKKAVDQFIRQEWEGKDLGGTSCETLCLSISKQFPKACFISVYEDNENGVEYYTKGGALPSE